MPTALRRADEGVAQAGGGGAPTTGRTGITQAFVDADAVRPEQVQVFIHEVDHENWANGGKLAVDVKV